MRKMRVALTLAAVAGSLGAGLLDVAPAVAAASTSVTPGAVSAYPATAGSNSSYTISFTATSSLAAGGTITFVAPAGTDFTPCPSSCSGAYAVAVGNSPAATVGSAASTGANGSATRNQVVLTLETSSIAAGDQVTVTTSGTTNPPAASSSYTIEESTSADTGPVASATYHITASEPASVTPVAGGGQSQEVGHAFPSPLSVEVDDSYGNPVPTATVSFDAPSSGASGTFASCPADVSGGPATECRTDTDGSGTATASTFTANSSTGTYTVTATVTTASGTATADFTMTNTAVPPSTVTPGAVTVSPDTVGASSATYAVTFTTVSALPSGDTIQLLAPDGTTFAGCPSTLTGCSNPTVSYTSGGATSAAPVTQATVSAAKGPGSTTTSTTPNQAVITVQSTPADLAFTQIPAGATVTVKLTGATNPQVAGRTYVIAESDQVNPGEADTSDYAVAPGAATQLKASSGTGQSATVTSPFAQPLVATAEDKYGNPVSAGTSVTFVLGATPNPGGYFPGSITQQTNLTNASGQATSSSLTADDVAGGWDATAELSGGVSPVTFALTNNADSTSAALQPATSGGSQHTAAGTPFPQPFVATVVDQYGNPVPGVAVTFGPSGAAGGTFAGGATTDTETTGSNGQATSSTFTAGTKAGVYTLEATSSAATGAASYPFTVDPGSPAKLVVDSGAGGTAMIGTTFAQPVTVTVEDFYGNAVPGTQVAFTTPNSGPGATFAGGKDASVVPADNQGRATSPTFTADTSAGKWILTAAVAGDSAVNVPVQETNTAGPASTFTLVSGSGQSAHVGRVFAGTLSTRVLDADHNPVAGQSVTFTLPTRGPAGTFPGGTRSATVTTDSNGVATAPPVQAGPQPGQYAATAATVVDGHTDRIQLTLTNTVGYWLAGSDGSVQAFGDAANLGSLAGTKLDQPVVGMAATPDGTGYWLVASDGGIFSFGRASFHGSTGGVHLVQPIVGMASTPDGGGYWLVASDGGIFAFGDAHFYGSTGGVKLNKPIVGMASTPDGGGYWLVASDGGIFAFGDAHFYGSTGGVKLDQPVVGMATAPGGDGYWLVAADGGIFSYGPGALFYGSTGGTRLSQPITGMAASPGGQGYWFVARDGGIFTYGPDAAFEGSGSGSGEPVVTMAAS